MLIPSKPHLARPPTTDGILIFSLDLYESLDSSTQLARELSAEDQPQVAPPPTASFIWSGYFDSDTQIARDLTDEHTSSFDWDDPGLGTSPAFKNILAALARDIPTANLLHMIEAGKAVAALSTFKKTWTTHGFPTPNHELLRGLERVGSIIRHPEILARHHMISFWIAKANRRLSEQQSEHSAKHWLLHFARETVGLPKDLAGTKARGYRYNSILSEEGQREMVLWQVRCKVAHIHCHYFDLGIWSVLGTEH